MQKIQRLKARSEKVEKAPVKSRSWLKKLKLLQQKKQNEVKETKAAPVRKRLKYHDKMYCSIKKLASERGIVGYSKC